MFKTASVASMAIAKGTGVMIFLILALNANAITPLTPQLTANSRTALLAKLTRAKFPEVAQNSVVIGLTAVLGFKAEKNSYDYEAAPHLPRVQAVSVPDGADCVSVRLHATFQKSQRRGIFLTGRYCLVGTAKWQATKQSVVRDK
jgi:hypothetical protein